MANLKNITELPMAESADGLNLIVNDNGAAKQMAASAVSVQADWNQNDPAKPDYVKNRPFYETEDGEAHKIPGKYLPDGFGGVGNVIVININEDDDQNQIYPEGLYDTIHNMITSNVFNTFIAVGFVSAQYKRSSHSYIVRIETVDDGYLLVPADYISNRYLHVRPDDTGYIEWMD